MVDRIIPLPKDATVPDNEGQVSEVSSLEGADQPIQPDQAVAGAPDAESGEVQEGRTGPNARTGDETSETAEDGGEDGGGGGEDVGGGEDGEDQAPTHG